MAGAWQRKEGKNECVSILMDSFNFVEPIECHSGKNHQLYCNFTKSGKHYIYAHFEKDTKNLFYIGLGKFNRCNQTFQRNVYWKKTATKHGIIIKFLEAELTLEDAIEKEKYYIIKYQPRTNVLIGGDYHDGSTQRVKVYSYLKNGNFYKSFNSITEANIFFNKKDNDSRISRCLNGTRKSFANLIWSKEYFDCISPYKKEKSYNQREVYRYDLNGNFIEKKEKIIDFKLGSSGICNTIDTNYTCYGSFWRSFYAEKIEIVKLTPALKSARRVINTETGEIYESIGIAAKSINCNRKSLETKLREKKSNSVKIMYYE
jgi:hypothetical protein